jgi:hypothetical protein
MSAPDQGRATMISNYNGPFFSGLGLSALILGMWLAGTSFGQSDPRPVSQTGGYGGTELGNIYREDVGRGYSVQCLKNIALENARARIGNYGQMSVRPNEGGRRGGGYNFQTSNNNVGKPFAGFSPSPTVSPYLNLFRDDFDGSSDFNYNTLVRPMLQQQQFNQQQQRQNMETARRLQSMSAQSDFNPEGSTEQYPTGHPTAYRYYGHFHPRAAYRPAR